MKAILRTLVIGIGLMASTAANAQFTGEGYHTDEYGHIIADLPYQTSFDNTYHEYTGQSFLPYGWETSGDSPFITASVDELKAPTGTYYAISPNNQVSPRNERLYTPFFEAKAGETYTLSFKLYMPGKQYQWIAADGFMDEEFRKPTFRLTAGEEQDYDFQTSEISTSVDVQEGWQDVKASFVPEADGTYCLCLAFTSENSNTGAVCVDDIMLSYEGAVLRPTATIAYNGLFSLMDSHLVAIEGQNVQFTGITSEATNYSWMVRNGKNEIVCRSSEQNPGLWFPESGSYDVILVASNSKYMASDMVTLDVNVVKENSSLWTPFMTYSDGTTDIYKSGTTPNIAPDDYDFITGPNHYYRRFAERIDLPQHATLSLQTLNYWISSCTFASVQTGTVEGQKIFTFSIYGEKDGLPDEEQVFFRQSMPMNKAISTSASGMGAPLGMQQALSGTATGPFYVAFEFPADVTLDTKGGNRTFVELTANRHKDGNSTLYYYSNDLQSWNKIDRINSGLAGTGLQMVVWGTLNVGPAPEGISTVGAQPTTRNSQIYDLQGRSLRSTQKGLYIAGGQKFLTR